MASRSRVGCCANSFRGLNIDESGMRVFDGVFSDFASAARGEFNHRFAQPSVAQISGFGTLAPFGHADLLARQRELGGVPKTIFTNSASEYWHGDGALLHVDPYTGKDLPEDPDVRTYLIAGTDHFGSSRSRKRCRPPTRCTAWTSRP